MTETHHQRLRLGIAREVADEWRRELGPGLIAAACYGSVAHHAAGPYSDVELTIITDGTVLYRDEYGFRNGVAVESTLVPAEQMLEAASRVPGDWGIKADQYRHHLVLWDPNGFFPRLHRAATSIGSDAFDHALRETWWTSHGLYGKILSALERRSSEAAIFSGWSFAYWAAMRIALVQRRPYESGRTLWPDATSRGYGLKELVTALANGSIQQLEPCLESVWRQTESWGRPFGYDEKHSHRSPI